MIENLLQISLGELISKSIGAEISETCALLLSNTYEERVEIEKKIKALYSVRSKIAHGASMNIVLGEYREMLKHAYKVIVSLILRTKKYKINKVEEMFDDREDFMYKLGITATSQETLDYWDED